MHPDVPKPMIPVLGRPFLYWVTAFFAGQGLRNVVYSTGHMGDQVAAWCQSDPMPGLTQTCCHEREPLGTGGGVLNARGLLGNWILVSNGDSLCLGGVKNLIALVGREELSGGLIGLYCSDTSRFGSLSVDEAGRLVAFREKVPGAGLINGGTYLFRKTVLDRFPTGTPLSIEQDVIPRLAADGHMLQVVEARDAPFLDIGTPETVVKAEQFICSNQAFFNYE